MNDDKCFIYISVRISNKKEDMTTTSQKASPSQSQVTRTAFLYKKYRMLFICVMCEDVFKIVNVCGPAIRIVNMLMHLFFQV